MEDVKKKPARTAAKNAYAKRGIVSAETLRRYYPMRYNDYTKATALSEDIGGIGADIAVICEFVDIKQRFENNRSITVSHFKDVNSGRKFTATFFGQYNIANIIASLSDSKILITGKFTFSETYRFTVSNPNIYLYEPDRLKIYTKYRKINRISDETLRKDMSIAIKSPEHDTIPADCLIEYNLPGLNDAFQKIHFPQKMEDVENGKARLIVDDLVYMHLQLSKLDNTPNNTNIIFKDVNNLNSVVSQLDYKLTSDQKNTIQELINTTRNNSLINALIQGDVSCGKSIIAFSLMVVAAENGYQSCIMAPTSILANQHFSEMNKLVNSDDIVLITSELTNKQKKDAIDKIKSGEYKYIIGTQALIANEIKFKNLGLAIIDEEHRFGVEQRRRLLANGIHTITMSATPIPRTIAKTVYGDKIQLYQIKQMPSGRLPVKTAYDNGSKKFACILKELKKGHQAYYVAPMIYSSTSDRMENVLSVEEAFEECKNFFEPLGYHVGCITGDNNAKEKAKIFSDFASGNISVLVSTTVIEVGINVPNATMIVIQNAERFGLATMHQLRGRVCRGTDQGYCLLVADKLDNRINTLCNTTDGFKVAEADLLERKAGNLIGTQQSGNNKLVEEMLSYPQLNDIAKKIAVDLEERGLQDEHIQKYEKIYSEED